MGIFGKLFGETHSNRAWRDQWRPSTMGKNMISPINDYGHCFSCEGTGQKTLTCRACGGSGRHERTCLCCQGSGIITKEAKKRFACQGKGRVRGKKCIKCSGTGVFRKKEEIVCSKCSGNGVIYSTCRKCEGSGAFTVPCKKCNGTGWYRF